eukprot:1151802-Pelagomonas_calceolata.AAC.11
MKQNFGSKPECRENDNFKNFDDFLLALKQSKRKSVKQAPITVVPVACLRTADRPCSRARE